MKINMLSIDYLQSKLDQMTPLLYVLTDDEHRSIMGIERLSQRQSNKFTTDVFIYKSTTGILPLHTYKHDIDEKKGVSNPSTMEINNALIQIYQDNKKDRRQIYIITEADHHLEDAQVVRRIKDFVIQADNSDSNLKIVILLSSRLHLPSKLEKYVDVFTYPYPSEDEIKEEITTWVAKFNDAIKDKKKQVEPRTDFEIVNSLKGLITPQIHQMITACIDITRKDPQNCGRGKLDPGIINALKREVINKTSLLKFKESTVSFKDVGGLGRLKKWFKKMHGGWTNEGQKFGLPVVKGALLIGLPGCGKSLICEALASEWNLNLIEFDPSKVFSSRVGESEGNMHLALARIESLAPAILFIDEIEKGFAGMQSSSFSDAGTTARTIGIFLIWMNNSNSWIFSVSTCNQIHILPPELVSRYDSVFYVGPPDPSERKEIIAIQIRNNKRDPANFDLNLLAGTVSNHLAGREIKHAVNEAMYDAFDQYKVDGKTDLNTEILKHALSIKIPVTKTLEKQLEHLVKWVGFDKERREGIRARFANNDMDEIDALFTEVLSNVNEHEQTGSEEI